jgi:hypothetical protein
MAHKCVSPAEKQRGRLVGVGDAREAFCCGIEFAAPPMRKTLGIDSRRRNLLRRLLPGHREQVVDLYRVERPCTRIASSSRHVKADPVSATVISEAAMVVP